ncbi:MAG TPA: CBS domain-containing protein [Steroidobacteraceae bacterium]|nr:CBS domain-containing protein [Steroidobacteraceae bacterium]
MRLMDVYTPRASTTFPDEPLAAAARRMSEEHIGALVVVSRGDAAGRPVGILTDRDIVRGQLRRLTDLFCLTSGDVMTQDPLVFRWHMEVTEAIEALSVHGIRRAPVVDETGALAGIITLDDLLPVMAQELTDLAGLMGTQARREEALRP